MAGIITGVTLVLTVNQLVLSQELGSLADQRDRLRGAMEYRTDVDDFIGEGASPAEPTAFLRSLVAGIGDRGRKLSEEHGSPGEGAAGEAAEFGASVAERADTVVERLYGSRFGDFDMLWAALHYNYSRQIQEGQSLLADDDRELSSDLRDRIEAIVRGLMHFGSAREHFKTLYFQRDLLGLSRALLGLALPALAVATLTLLYYTPAAFAGSILGSPGPVWAVSLAVVVSVAPFAVLLSYVLRIATVTLRTLAAGPFVLHPGRETGESFGTAVEDREGA